MTDDIIIRRLSLIKYLYRLGAEQANLPETISYTSILSFHDSIDMFMNLAAEKTGVRRGEKVFLIQYFDLMPQLTLKASVNKINKRRNGLKHDGIIPGKVEIQDSFSVAKLFLEENTKIIFAKDFNDISLFDLIEYEKVRNFLKAGSELLQNNELGPASKEVSKAYFHLLLIEESLNKTEFRNPWYDTDTKTLMNSNDGKFYTKAFEQVLENQDEIFREPKTKDGRVEISEGVAALANSYNKALVYIFETFRIFFLGLDYRKYNHYKSFMPIVYSLSTEENKYTIAYPRKHESELTNKNLNFAIDFVMEFALKLQQFKY